jgi:hypothetical protein
MVKLREMQPFGDPYLVLPPTLRTKRLVIENSAKILDKNIIVLNY